MVANPSKTVYIFVPHSKKDTRKKCVLVGENSIEASATGKILGMIINNTLTWRDHVFGKHGLLNDLNRRLFHVKRLSHNVRRERLKTVAHGIWVSKLRYGLGHVMSDCINMTKTAR